MTKRAAVITMGVSLDGEAGYSRFRSVSEAFVKAGYDTVLMTTTFQHWEKRQREIEKIDLTGYPYKVLFFYEPGYKRNLDLRRILSHRESAGNLKRLLRETGPYDVVYCEIPPNDVARAAGEYAGEVGAAFMIDVNDLWPEAMKMLIDIPVVNDLVYRDFIRDGEWVYKAADGVIGTSDEYRQRPFQTGRQERPSAVVYVGNDLEKFDLGAERNIESVHKPEGEFWVTYAGTLGVSYDIRTLILAAGAMTKNYPYIKVKILGDGPDRKKLERLCEKRGIRSVEFLGYQPYEKMAAWLCRSDILVNSFVKKAPQSVVTKIADYLAAGVPMINTGMSPEFRQMVTEGGFGVNVEPEDTKALCHAVVSLSRKKKMRAAMGRKAREMAETRFDRKNSYGKITEIADLLSAEKTSGGVNAETSADQHCDTCL